MERNDTLRVRWARKMLLFFWSAFVSCDESQIYCWSTFLRSSWASRRQRSHPPAESTTLHREGGHLLHPGGVLAEYITEHADGGSGQAELFWLILILFLQPNAKPAVWATAANHNQKIKSVLLVEDAPIHIARVDAFICARGRRVVRLSPYSPDFAPVEIFISKMKAELAEITTPPDLEGEGRSPVHLACLSIIPQDCSGHFATFRDHMIALFPELTVPCASLEGMLGAAPDPMHPW